MQRERHAKPPEAENAEKDGDVASIPPARYSGTSFKRVALTDARIFWRSTFFQELGAAKESFVQGRIEASGPIQAINPDADITFIGCSRTAVGNMNWVSLQPSRPRV